MKTHTLLFLTLVSLTVAASSADGGKKTRWKMKKAPALEKACSAGDQASCTWLAEYKSYGVFGASKDETAAQTMFATACEAGNGRACGKLAEYLKYHSKHDEANAAFEKGCELGDGSACFYRADRNSGDWPEIEKWIRKSYAAYEAACKTGDQVQCTELAIGMMSADGLSYGDYFSNDVAKAAKLLDKACKAGWPEACRQLGYAYESGSGVAQNDRKAKSFYSKACKAGNQDGCNDMAALIEDRKQYGIEL